MQLHDLFNMAQDEVLVKEFTLLFSWLKYSPENNNDWKVVISGGMEFKYSLDLEILERHFILPRFFKVRHNGEIFETNLGDIWQLMGRLSKQRGLDRTALISDALCKYYE